MLTALRTHWPEYLIEAAALGTFMVSACSVTLLIQHPGSPMHGLLADPTLRRVLTGVAMGLTAIAIVYSPWGRRSGAHMNPALTLTFLRLDKIVPWDAAFYVAAQFAGGIAGVALVAVVADTLLAHPKVRYAATLPGDAGVTVAFAAELVISFGMMSLVLHASNSPRLARYTGLLCGALLATWISVEAPLSGMSMNPARTLGSAVPARTFTAMWLYFTAPPLGMLLAGELYRRRYGLARVFCAKLMHPAGGPCIFRCDHAALRPS